MHNTDDNCVESRARRLYAAGFHRVAIDILTVHLSGHPDDGAAWRLRAVLLHRQGRWEEAFHDVQRALVLAPLGLESWVVLAEGYLRSGKRSSAADVFARLAGDEKLPADIWRPVFEGLMQLGVWQLALAVSRRAARARPEDDIAYYSMALAMLRGKQPVEQAVHLIEKSLALNPSDSRYQVTLAVQLIRLGRHAEAHERIANFSAETLASTSCRCGLEKFLRLAIHGGDAALAARLAERLSQIASTSPSKRAPHED